MQESVRNYCQSRNLLETAKILRFNHKKTTKNIEQIFENFFTNVPKKGNKLSFNYNVTNNQSLLKKRLAKDTVVRRKQEVTKKSGVRKVKNVAENEIPESFLLLMDELCLGRKEARKFFENPCEWGYIKSDRKIFCTTKWCEFSVTMFPGCFNDHCTLVHKWGKFHCIYDNCKFEAYNQKGFKLHHNTHDKQNKGNFIIQ